MQRTLFLAAAALCFGVAAMAGEAEDTALSACAAELSRTYGVQRSAVVDFQVRSVGDNAYMVEGYTEVRGERQQVSCRVANGRLSRIRIG